MSGPVGCQNLSVMPMTEQLLCGNKCGVQALPNLLPIHSSEVGIAACLSPRNRGFQSPGSIWWAPPILLDSN